jgi:hypothetical protein
MPTTVQWIRESLILEVIYFGDVSASDIESVMDHCLSLVEKSPCSFVIDTTRIESLPKDLFKLRSMIRFINHPNTDWLVFVGQHNAMIRFAIQVLVRKRVKLLSSRAEAIAFLEQVQQSSPSI